MFKKTTLAFLTLTSSISMAGTMGPVCEPGNATVPCAATAWDVGLTALYLRPAFDGDLTYFNDYINAQGHRAYRDESFDWGWGFRLEGSYHFNTGNDFSVNWYHFDNTTAKNYSVGNVQNSYSEKLSDKIRWDAVNFEFGQHVDFGEHKNIRFHGGAQYASIKSDVHLSNYVGAPANYVKRNMKFNGFGPRVGMDMSYDWMDGFGMYANVAGSLLVGDSKFDSAYFAGNVLNTYAGSERSVVPEAEAKIGGTYSIPLAQGTVSIDGGWMWVNYFNAIHGTVSDGNSPR